MQARRSGRDVEHFQCAPAAPMLFNWFRRLSTGGVLVIWVLWAGLAAALALAAVPLLVHLGFRAPRLRERGSPADFGLGFESVSIPTVRGRRLFGWWLSAGGSPETVVVLHGWGSNAEQMLPIAAPLRRAGLNVLLVDARCHGHSDGDTFASLPRFAEDLLRAIRWLKRARPTAAGRIAVLGHSVGAGAALLAASRCADISAVISVAAFADPAEVTDRYLRHLRLPRWAVRLVIGYTQWLIGHRFEAIAPINTICRVRCPVLLVHGLADRMVPVADAHAIAEGCPAAPVRLLTIDGAGHASTEAVEQHADALLAFLDAAWGRTPGGEHGGGIRPRRARGGLIPDQSLRSARSRREAAPTAAAARRSFRTRAD